MRDRDREVQRSSHLLFYATNTVRGKANMVLINSIPVML